MNENDRIFIAGHRGMVGSAVHRLLEKKGFSDVITRSRAELDLRNSQEVADFFVQEKPDYVILAAAKVGGIKANNEHPAEFLYDNLMIQNNIIHHAYLNDVKKLCFLGSSCIYPRECPQPIKEEYLLTGPLEPTNEGYAIAKIAGYKLAYYYANQYGFNTISLMPCNLYGTNDDYNLETSHVFSALIKRFADAVDEAREEVIVWGTGIALREFLNVDDLARAVYMLMQNWNSPEFVNVGSGSEISIRNLAEMIAEAAGFSGKITWDSSKPDGMLRKCMDVSKIRSLGFAPEISLEQGVRQMLSEYRELKQKGRIPA